MTTTSETFDPGKPLAGLLVVSLEQAVAEPYCSSRLADAGARVIKIERAEGDFARGYDYAVNGLATYFVWLNATLLHRILEQADVFIQNPVPGAAKRAGFGSDVLQRSNSRLVTVDISGHGVGNSYTDMKAYDLLVQAETGVAGIIGHPAGPGRVSVSVCDVACGMSAYAGVLEALVGRSRRNRGARLEVSLFDAVADWMNVPLLYFEGTGAAPQRVGLAHPSICPYGVFETFDGHLVLISIQNEREWASLCTAFLGEAELPKTPGFESNNARVANRPAVDAKVAASFRELSRERAAEILRAAQIAYGFVNDLADLASLPALRRVSIGTSAGVALVIAPAVIHDQRTPQFGPVPQTANTQTKCGASSRRNKSKTRGA